MAILIFNQKIITQIPTIKAQLRALVGEIKQRASLVPNCVEFHFKDSKYTDNEIVLAKFTNRYEGIKTEDELIITGIHRKLISYR